MEQDIYEWLHLFGRWAHITTGITWIGTSIFFMWLDRTFDKGELWMVHGGGFYHVQKHMMGETQVPKILHWFKWESYWTWMTGIFLFVLLFLSGGGTFLVDASLSSLSFSQALLLTAFAIFGSWFYYDFLWERKIVQRVPALGHGLTLAWVLATVHVLFSQLSGRAAYIVTGAMLGTWMTANVFLRIIPRQVKMVEAAKKGQSVDPSWGVNAKYRSTHNTYFTLPVIMIMLSNHFPLLYGHKLGAWLLVLLIAGGASIRHYFILREKNHGRALMFAGVGIACILAAPVLQMAGSKQASAHAQGAHLQDNDGGQLTAHQGDESEQGSLFPSKLRGAVTYDGRVPDRKKLAIPSSCLSSSDLVMLDEDFLVLEGRVKNVLVYVSSGISKNAYPAPKVDGPAAVIDQRNCMYSPRVIGIRSHQGVKFINSDPVFHNVRSVSDVNPVFNVGMPKQNESVIKIFDMPEIYVTAKCDVHPWMKAVIGVFDHPFFAVTNDRGEYQIRGLPPGKYELTALHEVLGKKTFSVEIKTEGEAWADVLYSNRYKEESK